MIKIKEGNTEIEITNESLEGSQSLMVSIDKKEIVFANISECGKEEIGPEPEPEAKQETEKAKVKDKPELVSESEGKTQPKKISNATKYTNKILLEELLRLCCKLGRFPKTVELDNEKDMASYNTYYNRMGNLSNIIDKLGHAIKAGKATDKMTQIMCDFCSDHELDVGWENMWGELVKNTKESSGHKPRGISTAKQIMRGDR